MQSRTVASVLAGALVLAAWSDLAWSQSFPTRPVTFIVPYGVGGPVDFQLRALASATEKHLGQPITIMNRPSATGTLGPAQMVASAKPDGYTITQINTGLLRLPFMTSTPYDPATDFSYIIRISGLTAGLVVRQDAPWKTFAELLAYAKANPGKLTYGAPAGAANPNVIMRLIAKRYDIRWTAVPFKSFAESSVALLGGHIDMISDAAGWAPMVKAGELRLLVTYGAARSKSFAVPTLAEHGIGVVENSAYGIAGPRGMDSATVGVLHDALKQGMDEPSFRAVLKQLEQEPMYQNTVDYRAYIAQELIAQKAIVQELGLRQE